MSMTVAMTPMVATMPTVPMVSWQCTGGRREGQNNLGMVQGWEGSPLVSPSCSHRLSLESKGGHWAFIQ